MKKASLFASAAVAAVALGAAPVFAQNAAGPFADVPADHWAYSAVDKLQKAGIVIGYPDMTYGGKRSMTRYEFAVAIARLLDKIPTTAPQPDLTPYVKKDDLPGILAPYALKSDLDRFATKDDLETLRKLVSEFQTELTTLGVDLDAVKRRVDALEGRVRALEIEQKRVQISGAVNLMGRANYSSNGDNVVDYDGFQIANGGRQNVFGDAFVLHDIDLKVKARLSSTATAETVLNFGNYLSYINSIGSYSGQRSNRTSFGGTVNQDETQTVYKAVLDVPVRIFNFGGIDLEAGRLPIQFTPYTLKLIDTDSYFFNDKTDLGDIPVDGGKVRFALGPVTATAFAAKTDPIKFLSDETGTQFGNGTYGLFAGAGHGAYGTGFLGSISGFGPGNRPTGSSIAPGKNGAMYVEQLGGFHANIGSGSWGSIGGTYLVASGLSSFQSTLTNDINSVANFDRVFVYGADANINTHILGGIGLTGSYTKSDTKGTTANGPTGVGGVATSINLKSSSKITKDNDAWEAGANYHRGNLGLNAGYRYIGPYFGAPGYWDKIGSYTNPTDVKGPYVGGNYNFSNNFALVVEAKFYQGTGTAKAAIDGGNGAGGGLLTSDKITNLKAGLRYGLTSASGIDAGIERTEYKIGDRASALSGDKPVEYFYNIGYGYSFNPATSFKLLYQIIDFEDKGPAGATFDPLNSGKGGVAAAQFSVKF